MAKIETKPSSEIGQYTSSTLRQTQSRRCKRAPKNRLTVPNQAFQTAPFLALQYSPWRPASSQHPIERLFESIRAGVQSRQWQDEHVADSDWVRGLGDERRG